ncbi:MAG: WD40 repeat domain-containing protein [Gemmataceae bacterium]|nr:WD40 repeat domain-containing protein [Gemmataceae bacterium]
MAKVRLTFDSWKEGNVAPSSFDILVLPAKIGPKLEPVSPALLATLPHPERSANICTVTYSPDGQRLFTAGYPSGVLQFWNVETRQEQLRISTPRGYRGSWNYALLTSDWKMLYVPTEDRKVITTEQNGQKLYRFEYTGVIRRWDLTTRSELDPLVPPQGYGNQFAMFTPDQQFLLSIERMNRTSTDPDKAVTVLWNLKTGQRQEWADGFAIPNLSADGRRAVIADTNFETKSTVLKITTFPERKVLMEKKYDAVDGQLLKVVGFSPDGKILVCELGAKKGAKPTILFLDSETLAEQARWTGATHDELNGWVGGRFTPDGTRFLVTDGQGVLHVWNVAAKRVERTVAVGEQFISQSAISPSGRWLALAWMPKLDPSVADSSEPDPEDLPQPRITLVNLDDAKAKPITLIAPQGYVGSLTFRPDGKQLAFGSAGGVHLFDLTKLGLDPVK